MIDWNNMKKISFLLLIFLAGCASAEHKAWKAQCLPNTGCPSELESPEEFAARKIIDKKCEENGIYLITVPYNVPHHKLREFIIAHLPNDAQSDEGEDDQEDSREEGSEVTFSEMQSAISDLNEEIHQVFSNNRNIPTSVCYKEYLA